MKPRVDIAALSMTADYETVKRTIIESGFSRIPVYEEDVDNIRGTLYVKDLLPYINNGGDFAWQQLIRKPYFVPEHKKINDLLADFQSNKVHMAIVVDEYGSTLGLVSLEDIIEEIVGEISDESDNDECFYTRLDAKSYIFEGKTHLGDFERILDIGEDLSLIHIFSEPGTIRRTAAARPSSRCPKSVRCSKRPVRRCSSLPPAWAAERAREHRPSSPSWPRRWGC